jgi:sugar O-acyltransferase (sialic acid O-acetyltransferase NeuD family)
MKNDKQLIIVGTGETAMLAYEYFTYDSNYEVVAFAVNREFIQDLDLYGLPIIALEEVESLFPSQNYKAFIAVSSGKLNRNRTLLYNDLKNKGYSLASYVSSKAFVWQNIEVGENCFILEDNTLQPFVTIGNNVTLWSGNHIGHRTIIKDNCFISSHCVISGYCEIGESCFLGVNCTVENNVRIARDNFVGAGALIQKNTNEKEFFQLKQTELSKVDTHRLFRVK